MTTLQWIFAIVFAVGIPAGLIGAIFQGGWHPELDHLRNKEDRIIKKKRHLPRDSHAQAYFDGFITAEVLDELDDMFK